MKHAGVKALIGTNPGEQPAKRQGGEEALHSGALVRHIRRGIRYADVQ
jgi:hypothetical protein